MILDLDGINEELLTPGNVKDLPVIKMEIKDNATQRT